MSSNFFLTNYESNNISYYIKRTITDTNTNSYQTKAPTARYILVVKSGLPRFFIIIIIINSFNHLARRYQLMHCEIFLFCKLAVYYYALFSSVRVENKTPSSPACTYVRIMHNCSQNCSKLGDDQSFAGVL